MCLVNGAVAALAELVDLVEAVGGAAELLVPEPELRRGDRADDLAGAVHVIVMAKVVASAAGPHPRPEIRDAEHRRGGEDGGDDDDDDHVPGCQPWIERSIQKIRG